jgi:hypothetical protein
LAGVVVGASVSGAVWLYTYRGHDVIRFIDAKGAEYNDRRHVSVQPWWGVYAALTLLAVGLAAAFRLLPNRTTRRTDLRSLRALDPR